ncbi:MAG: HD domain-containing protein [Planctomycetaceae bacterium]
MSRWKLREAIAAEAARLLLRGEESDYLAARKRAARWLSRKRLPPEDLPTSAEIQSQLYALAGLFSEEASPADDAADAALPAEEGYHPDTLAVFRMLLERLESVNLDPIKHPEGDALYHSLQVFELGRLERPYDEEFLLACLLHDVGLGIDRRHAIPAALVALAGLVTERTLLLIERLPDGGEYLKTGRMPRSLRRSEHFDDLVLLAKCDRDGRVRGAAVCEVEDALDYIAGLGSAWDEA